MKKGSGNQEEGGPATDRETYCGRLGHFVPYSYCLKPAQDTPCFKILDCWWQTFDVVEDLRTRLSPADFEKIVSRKKPPNRMEGILDIMEGLRKDGALK